MLVESGEVVVIIQVILNSSSFECIDISLWQLIMTRVATRHYNVIMRHRIQDLIPSMLLMASGSIEHGLLDLDDFVGLAWIRCYGLISGSNSELLTQFQNCFIFLVRNIFSLNKPLSGLSIRQ